MRIKKSRLEYGQIALLSANCHKKSLEILQNKALRVILGRNRETPINELLNEADIKPIEERIKELAKGWFVKAQQKHPLVLKADSYNYDQQTDRIETLYNILLNL